MHYWQSLFLWYNNVLLNNYKNMTQYIKYFCLFLFSFSTLGLYAEVPRINRRHEHDDREVKNDLTPDYLNAVGSLGLINKHERLRAKKYRNIECGANLIALDKNQDSNLVITAEHCIDPKFKEYSWTSFDNNNKKVFREGKLIYKNEETDIAIIKLKKQVSQEQIKPFVLSNNKIHNSEGNYVVAGFSVDSLGNYGKNLTYDENPDYIKLSENGFGEIGTITYQGDSGGAVVYNDPVDDTHYLVGVMSYIEKNKDIFINEVGKFGNVSGHFVDLVNYESIYNSLLLFIKNKVI